MAKLELNGVTVLFLVLLFFLTGRSVQGAEGALTFEVLGPGARVDHRADIRVRWPSAPDGNSFDPDEVALDVVVRPPSGEPVAVAGFLYQDYDRRLDGNREILTKRGEPEWRVRYLPSIAGRHTLEARGVARGEAVATGRLELPVREGTRRGLVRVEPRARRTFQLDDGTPLFLIGMCCSWHGSRGTYDYDDWLPAAAKAGMNYIRIWMWPHAFGIEWDKGDRLRYKLDRAWTVDRVLAEAERLGMYVMVCLDYHGMFEVKKDYFGGNNYWPSHPYNTANGGPCGEANDFFTSPDAASLYEKRLRYIVARWGSFRSVLAWQFFNEIDNVYRYLEHEDVVAWHERMARHLGSIDPYRHLITTSLTSGSERPEIWKVAGHDFAQWHSYNAERPADMTAEVVARFHERYQKPVFVGEYGTDWKGWKPEQDPHFRALHQAVWSGAFSGAAGTAMSWWWESIHANRLYGHWTALAAFLEGTGIARPEMEPAELVSEGESKVLAYGIASGREALCWFLDPAYNWPAGGREAEPELLEGARVRLSGLDNGPWEVEWCETREGRVVQTNPARVEDGGMVLNVPGFRVDVAARIRNLQKEEDR